MSSQRRNVCQEKSDELGLFHDDPIVIVGAGMRLPGGVNSASSFWEMLMNKNDGHGDVPASRFNASSFVGPSKGPTTGYFLQEDPAYFDASFFSISAVETMEMDPQQRLLMEVVWECLENAGETRWQGKSIGCFVGTFGEDWLELSSKDSQVFDRSRPLHTGGFALSNRVSYEFDFRGPSMTIQTACSASLVCLHQACQSLQNNQCSSAIVAGTNIILSPTTIRSTAETMVFSPSGKCRTFDALADGYGRAEAVNAIYIKRLSSAFRDNSPIRAIIRGTATNFDGKTRHITNPCPIAQEELIRTAYQQAGIEDLHRTAFFECHGTGTVMGDSVETATVAKLFAPKGIIIGAVKPNLGHSEGSSGLTSVIKAMLMLENKVIPPNTHFEHPSTEIPFVEGNLQVPLVPTRWPEDRDERVSVNSFGIGGSNAHVIMDSAARVVGSTQDKETIAVKDFLFPPQRGSSQLLVVTAHCNESLRVRTQDICDYLNRDPSILADLSYTLAMRREHFAYRAFAITHPFTPLQAPQFLGMQSKGAPPGVTFIFTGQGAQWAGMGKILLETESCFKKAIETMDEALGDLEDPPRWTLKEELGRDNHESRIDEPEFTQPLCTALQVALVDMLATWHIRPGSVIGHSSGEIAAAYAAGAINSRSAIIIAYYRGKFASSLNGNGAMIAVGLSRQDITPYLKEGVVLACENSPASVTLSGDIEAINQALDTIKAASSDILCKKLRHNVAYHSHHMDAVGSSYESAIAPYICHGSHPMLPMVSSVTCGRISGPQKLDASYWRRNLESPVLFSQAVHNLLQDDASKTSNRVFIEVGPHAALGAPLRQIFQHGTAESPVYIPTLVQDDDNSRAQLLCTAGHAFVAGVPVNLAAIVGDGQTLLNNLPVYPWKHDIRYWNESRLSSEWRLRALPHHELLGSRIVEVTDLHPSWRNLLHIEKVLWLEQHILQGQIVFPGAGYIAMAGEAVQQIHPEARLAGYSIRNIHFKAPLLIDPGIPTEIITAFYPIEYADDAPSGWYSFMISAYNDTSWIKYCQGQVRPGRDEHHLIMAKHIQSYVRPVSCERWYETARRLGLEYGPRFRGLRDISTDPIGSAAATGTATDPSEVHDSRYTQHPVIIDQCLQLMGIAASRGIMHRLTKLYIPVMIESLYVGSGAPEVVVNALAMEGIRDGLSGNAIGIVDGKPVLAIEKALLQALDGISSGDHATARRLASRLVWKPDLDLAPPSSLLSIPQADSNYDRHMRFGGFISLVYIIETAERIRHLESESAHLMKWRNWLLEESQKIRQCKSVNFTQLANWIRDVEWEAPYIIQLQQLIQQQAHGCDKDIYPTLPPWAHWNSAMRKEMIRLTEESIDIMDYSIHVTCMQQILHHCREIMSGACTPLEILLEDDRLAEYYKLPMQHTDWSSFLTLLCHLNPRLRVLEIGGGSGFATSLALPHLKTPEGHNMYSSYTFTDISLGFMAKAKEKFEEEASMEYQILDISRDPGDQGFPLHSFDLIIADNVLHATPSLQKALKHVHMLLAPRGRFLLHELHPELLITDYIMGTLPGWWLGENDGRPNRPYVSPERWDQELRAAGFTGAELVVYDAPAPCQASATILSQVRQRWSIARDVVLLTRKNATELSGWVSDVEVQLRSRGYSIEWTTLDQPPPENKQIISLLEIEDPYLHGVMEEDYNTLQNYLVEARRCALLWITNATQLVCNDPRFGFIHGLTRVLRHELQLDISILQIETFDSTAASIVVDIHEKIQVSREEALPGSPLEYDFVFANGAVHIGRYNWTTLAEELAVVLAPKIPRKLDIGSFGRLHTMRWVPKYLSDRLEEKHLEVDIHFVGLNFKDLMVLRGMIGKREELGIEATGVVRRVGADVTEHKVGDHVILFETGLLATRKVIHHLQCMKIPEGLTLQDAATMSVVYLTAIHSLVKLGQIRKDTSVLIHSACGGVGMAAINICQMFGAEVYATVGNEEKVQYLTENFGLPRGHIFHSHDSSFVSDIMHATQGKGVDLVLNSLAGNLLHASWKCVAPYGKMVELGKRDFMTHGVLDMSPFLGNRTFHGVDMLAIHEEDTDIRRENFTLFHEWLQQGFIKPISPATVFDAPDVVEAFRYLEAGKHMGKVVIRMSSLSDASNMLCHAVTPSPTFSSDAAYLLVGGLGGIGQSVSTWMVEHGARELVYLSRTAGQSDQHRSFIRELEAQGCQVTCINGNVTDLEDVRRAVIKCRGRLAGIFHMALSLKDRTFRHMSHEEWVTGISPKADGAWNLHQAVEGLSLDFFVLFGSVVGILQTGGQANYAAANTFLDAFAAFRQQQGLAASVINLGFVEDVGIVSRSSEYMHNALISGAPILGETDVLRSIQLAIRDSSVSSHLSPLSVGIGYNPQVTEKKGSALPPWGVDARFSLFANIPLPTVEAPAGKMEENEIRVLLAKVAQDPSVLHDRDKAAVVTNELGRAMWRMMAIDKKEMSDDEIAAQVIDSLAAIEVRNWIRRVARIELSMADMQRAGTVAKLAEVMMEHLRSTHN